MAADIFLRLDNAPSTGDIIGESTTEGLPDWIEVESYSLGCTQEVTGARSTSGAPTSGRADHNDVSISKQMDRSTAGLMACCCAGEIIPTGEIAHYSMVNNEKVLFAHFWLTELVITECSLDGSDGVPSESLSLSYGGIAWWYLYLDHQTGQKHAKNGGPFCKNWDVIKNTSMSVPANQTAPGRTK